MITFEKAKELFIYDRDTGIIKWRKRTSNRQRSNMVAGSAGRDGYIQIRFKGKNYFAHRVAVLLAYGFCGDEMEIDHINHVRNDNRLVNLRFVTRTDNGKNLTRSSKNTSGITGVYYRKAARKYEAYIKADGAYIYLGKFATLEEAAKVR